ncbi:hypothetical protein [Thermus brockianus]|uniref:Uncharacterized protein n=1 Tax=Thermus brockianus TaxID=56956 RepID=A0A1J0LTS6_THEBO|nr:hypothetical protein [Thermus brockianus]APD09750.1 hypothetical protein A0O31_01642 [Thermus brockianus]
MPELKPADEQDLLLEHGEVYVAEGRWGKAYFRPPQEPEYSRFVATAAREGANLYAAQKTLVLDCLLKPSRAEFAEIVRQRPGLVPRIATDLIALAQDEEARFLAPLG